jgi:adenylate kinase
MNILLLGPQGCGKGTQGQLLSQKYNLFYLSTGQMLREIAKTDESVAAVINSGSLISDDFVLASVAAYFDAKGFYDNIIMDGSPRSVYQYQGFKAWFASKGSKVDLAFWISISHEETIRRLSSRRMDSQTGKIYNMITNPPPTDIPSERLTQRADDMPAAIQRRLEEFDRDTLPLKDILQEEGILIEVNGERSIEDIQNDIVSSVEHYIHGEHKS